MRPRTGAWINRTALAASTKARHRCIDESTTSPAALPGGTGDGILFVLDRHT
jgi:hypothetical protein